MSSSFIVQNVLTATPKNQRHGEHASSRAHVHRQPDFRSLLSQARKTEQPMMSPSSVRERFGQGAVRDYKKSSLEIYRKIQELP